jgi:hypothetical protein
VAARDGLRADVPASGSGRGLSARIERSKLKISTVLDKIDEGAIALPEFQRGYVWNRTQVRGLMHSLYRRYPVGGLLMWLTKTEAADARGHGSLQPGFVSLLLDGQQRMTSLYGIARGRPPEFFEGNADAFTGLRFHLAEERFEFYAPMKMKDDPLWIDVTTALRPGGDEAVMAELEGTELPLSPMVLVTRVGRLRGVLDTELHVEEVTGDDMTTDVVVEIFNRVNSGGTRLSKGDLALARLCATWPDARDEMKGRLAAWREAGFSFSLDWLLRNVNAIVTGRAEFSNLADVDVETFKTGLAQAERSVNELLNIISGRLGLDHHRVLGGYAAFPLMARYLAERGWKLSGQTERDKLLYWYVNTFLWGRYAGSTETVLNADLNALQGDADSLDRLIALIRQSRGDLRVTEDDFRAWSQGARFYPLLYMLTRVHDVRDWGTGVPLRKELLGKLAGLEVHHIFPKNLLYKAGYSRPEVNALANFTFLTKATNLEVTNRDPAEYIPQFEERHAGVMASHWIPTDPDLWRIENYLEFLAERRRLLAAAANSFLDELAGGTAPDIRIGEPVVGDDAQVVVVDESEDEEAREISECRAWVVKRGLDEGVANYELVDEETGGALAILDVAWPVGLQLELSEPVALLLNEPPEVERATAASGFRFFTTVDAFKAYVQDEVVESEAA